MKCESKRPRFNEGEFRLCILDNEHNRLGVLHMDDKGKRWCCAGRLVHTTDCIALRSNVDAKNLD
jgi:hypothetical protein